jgi:glutaredoxin 3
MAKDFFKEKNVEFEDFNVASDQEKRKEMIMKSGQMGVPVIQIGDSIIVGYNKPKIVELLGISE